MAVTTKDIARPKELEKEMIEEPLLDFGFSTESEEPNGLAIKSALDHGARYKEKLDYVLGIFYRLLDNLAEHPENPYIKWPDRLERIVKIKEQINKKLKE